LSCSAPQLGNALSAHSAELVARGQPEQPDLTRQSSYARQPFTPPQAYRPNRCDQFAYWKHTQLIIDVVPGRGSGFSVEAPEGVRFLTRSRVFTDEEVDALEKEGVSVGGQAA
jgi:Protein of unknown function (DUF779)